MSDRFLAEPCDFASGHPTRKALKFPPERLDEKSHPMNPMPAPANRPLILLLHPPASEIAKYPCETTMATPPPVRSAEPTTQNLTWLPEHPALTPVPDRPGATVLAFRLVYVDSDTCDGGYGSHNDNDRASYEQARNGKRSTPYRGDTSKHITPDGLAGGVYVVDGVVAGVGVEIAVAGVGEYLVGRLLG